VRAEIRFRSSHFRILQRGLRVTLLCGLIATLLGPMGGITLAQSAAPTVRRPFGKREIVELVKLGTPDATLIARIGAAGINFEVMQADLDDLTKAGASRELLTSIREASNRLEIEELLWNDLGNKPSREALEAFVLQFPNGQKTPVAKQRLQSLGASPTPVQPPPLDSEKAVEERVKEINDRYKAQGHNLVANIIAVKQGQEDMIFGRLPDGHYIRVTTKERKEVAPDEVPQTVRDSLAVNVPVPLVWVINQECAKDAVKALHNHNEERAAAYAGHYRKLMTNAGLAVFGKPEGTVIDTLYFTNLPASIFGDDNGKFSDAKFALVESLGAPAGQEIPAWNTPVFCTDIHDAAKSGDMEAVKSLLKSNPDLVFSKDDLGLTPLHWAASEGRKDVADFLLANKANINAKDNNGDTPLHQAAALGKKDVAALLLANKADVNAKDNNGDTPLHQAAAKDHKDIAELLLANKAEIDAKGKNGMTPLYWAAFYGKANVAQLLLAHKADANTKDNNGNTPLHQAAGKDHKDIAELLLANKAEIDAKDKNGTTPLHVAASSGRKEIVELLLASNADVNATDNSGRTPLAIAVSNSKKDVTELLRLHGGEASAGVTGRLWPWGTRKAATLHNRRNAVVAQGNVTQAADFMTIKGHKGASFTHRPSATALPAEAYSKDTVGDFARIEFEAGDRWTLKDGNFFFILTVPDSAGGEVVVDLDKSLARASLIKLPKGTYTLWGYTLTVVKPTGTVKFAHGKIIEASDASFR
jgi:ankyrin repeat protein